MKCRTGTSGRIERGSGLKVLAGLRFAWKAAFAAACKNEGIDPTSKFAVFSDANPFRVFVDNAASEYFEAVRSYNAGGYIGLRMTP
jgi:hypothetical protein